MKQSNSLHLPSAILSVIVVPVLSALSYSDHFRSTTTSDGINIYLFFGICFDAIQVRTLWFHSTLQDIAICYSVGVLLKTQLFILELHSKASSLLQDLSKLSPESWSGVFSRRFFWWLNSLLKSGYRGFLHPDQLFPLPESIKSQNLLQKIGTSCSASQCLLILLTVK
jgi:ATP-binding cassette, subfamily C (CFTR/MRP), member 1